ncbi:MAG: hypothetical protein ACPGNV_18420, partial [Mangrovicoccus sp.]
INLSFLESFLGVASSICIFKYFLFIYLSALNDIRIDVMNKGPFRQIIWRWVPVLRSICSYSFGRARVRTLKFILLTFIGMGSWVLFWIALGYVAGEIAQRLGIFITLVISAIFTFLVRKMIFKIAKGLKQI